MTAYIVALLMGALTWTFMEYVLHRFAGHVARGRNHFSREHLRHHGTPDYFSPAWQKWLSAMVAIPIAGAVWALFAGVGPGVVFGLSFGGMYAVYEWLHMHLHTHAPQNRYGRWARRHHFYHHFGDPELNHGVTSPIWDIVFRTHVVVEQVAVPRKRAMRWLTDAEGQLHPQHAAEYQLTDKRMARA